MSAKRSITWGALVVAALLVGWPRSQSGRDDSALPGDSVTKLRRHGSPASSKSPLTRNLSIGRWKREVETLFGECEARRSTILGRKETEESDIYLLGVVPPSGEEIRTLRGKLDALAKRARPDEAAARAAELEKIIADYDPFGSEGQRVILIDVPRDPGGRLSGFTCVAGDFHEITLRFEEGSMTDLENLRGYAAAYAGMPLTRFKELIVTDEPE